MVRLPGFEPEREAWEAPILPGWITAAQKGECNGVDIKYQLFRSEKIFEFLDDIRIALLHHPEDLEGGDLLDLVSCE